MLFWSSGFFWVEPSCIVVYVSNHDLWVSAEGDRPFWVLNLFLLQKTQGPTSISTAATWDFPITVLFPWTLIPVRGNYLKYQHITHNTGEKYSLRDAPNAAILSITEDGCIQKDLLSGKQAFLCKLWIFEHGETVPFDDIVESFTCSEFAPKESVTSSKINEESLWESWIERDKQP